MGREESCYTRKDISTRQEEEIESLWQKRQGGLRRRSDSSFTSSLKPQVQMD
jgi:hypothetical protein